MIDTSTGTVQLKGSFPNAEHALWPGQYVQAHLILGQRKQALTVPAAAVQRGPDGIYAYVVAKDDTVHMQPIQLIGTQDGLAVVAKGLSAGQRVVLDGQYKLKPGLRVTESQGASVAGAENSANVGKGGTK